MQSASSSPAASPGFSAMAASSSDEAVMFDDSQSNPIKRQLARKTLQAVQRSASNLVSATKSRSSVLKFALEAVELISAPATEYALDKIDPLLTSLDNGIDAAVDAIQATVQAAEAEGDAQERAYREYWEKVKMGFVNSRWFKMVDDILLQNAVMKVVAERVVRPAEIFYNTATEVYMISATQEEFLLAMRERLGVAWDDRLTQPAKVFFSTARTAAKLVGAGKFFGGAIQLGRHKIHSAIDELLDKWEQVLGTADEVVDNWLPDMDLPQLHASAPMSMNSMGSPARLSSVVIRPSEVVIDQEDSIESKEDADLEMEAPAEMSHAMHSGNDDIAVEHDTGIYGEPDLGNKKRRRANVGEITSKVSRRLRQRMPTVAEIGHGFKQRLIQSSWFQKVDEILLQNVLVRAMYNQVLQPAEHFYQTATRSFRDSNQDLDSFMGKLKQLVGMAWDERLREPAADFFLEAQRSEAEQATEQASLVEEIDMLPLPAAVLSPEQHL